MVERIIRWAEEEGMPRRRSWVDRRLAPGVDLRLVRVLCIMGNMDLMGWEDRIRVR
jgi:hypothetical protein